MKKKAFSVLATVALATFISTGSADAATNLYTVKTGDTLWKIATQHKLTVDELKSLNNLASDAIKVDQKLSVSANMSGASKPAPAKANSLSTPTTTKNTVARTETSSINSWTTISTPTVMEKNLSLSAEKIVLNATEMSLPLLNTPYAWSGVTKEGFDCSGFIYYVFTAAGLDMPRFDTIGMYNNSSYVGEPVPGDLVFFENTYRSGISHAGIYLGNGSFIHAGTKKVEIASIDSVYWKDKFTGFKRFDLLN